VQRVPGTIRHNPPLNGLTNQGKIPEKIQNLVAHEFVRESEGSFIKHSFIRENDGIFQRAAAHQPAGLQLLHFFKEAKRPGRGYQIRIIRRSDLHFELLMANQGMRKTDFILDTEALRRMDRDGLSVFLKRKRFCNAQDVTFRIQRDDAHALDPFDIGKPAAVKYRNFKVVELDNRVIDAQTVHRGKQVFHRGNPNAAIHQCGRIGDTLHRTDVGTKFKIVEVNSAEYDSASGRRRKYAHGCGLAGMQADAAEFHWRRDGLFSHALST
jgi:hypothetical protein